MMLTKKQIRAAEKELLNVYKDLLGQFDAEKPTEKEILRADGLVAGSIEAIERMAEYALKGLNTEDGSEFLGEEISEDE